MLAALAAGICGAAWLLPYVALPNLWWRAIPSFVAIVLTTSVFQGRNTLRFLGLRMSLRHVLGSAIICLATFLLFDQVVVPLLVNEHLSMHPHFSTRSAAHQFFQVLNDELLLRAALITVLLRAFPRPKIVIFLPAVVLALGHNLAYRRGDVHMDPLALLSLFSFVLVANCLFLKYRHIGYSAALHFGWNLGRFSHSYSLDGTRLSEGATFNYVEGNLWVSLGSVVALLAVLGAYAWDARIRRPDLNEIEDAV